MTHFGMSANCGRGSRNAATTQADEQRKCQVRGGKPSTNVPAHAAGFVCGAQAAGEGLARIVIATEVTGQNPDLFRRADGD